MWLEIVGQTFEDIDMQEEIEFKGDWNILNIWVWRYMRPQNRKNIRHGHLKLLRQ